MPAVARIVLEAGTYTIKNTTAIGVCKHRGCTEYDRVEIIGAGEEKTILDGCDSVSHFSIFSGGCLKLSDLTVSRGLGGAGADLLYGGAITMGDSLQDPVSTHAWTNQYTLLHHITDAGSRLHVDIYY